MTNDDFYTKRSTHLIWTQKGWRRIATLHDCTVGEAASAALALSEVFFEDLDFGTEALWLKRSPYEAVMADGYEIDGMTRAKA